MKHIIISDTHSPQCIDKALDYAKTLVEEQKDVDAIVINGDLLGIFSMASSNIYKGKWIPDDELKSILQSAAPKFFEKFMKTNKVTKAMVYEYVGERYAWAYKVLKEASKINKTIFNIGNHESKLHFLVLNEIPFLTKCDRSVVDNLDQKFLGKIYNLFEKNLYELEETHNFKYIRDNIVVEDKTLIMGIPGESHGTTGNDENSLMQERKTKQIVAKAETMIYNINKIIIYNHTQSSYDDKTGNIHTASISLKKFMKNLPKNIKQRIYIQSHNHWSYTQFMQNDGFKFILNNAGLHDGIFNLINFNEEELHCYDADPNELELTRIPMSKSQELELTEDQIIGKYYPNSSTIMTRRNKGKGEKNSPIYN